MYNLVLLEQFSPSSECWEYLIRNKKIHDLTVDEIEKIYQGFEGELISIYSSEKEMVSIEKTIIFKMVEQNFDNRRLIYVSSEAKKSPPLLNFRAVFMGYDVSVS